ncbi:MAG: HAMP domain-containing histidine kinase [Cytophagales bacterium]|nr:HAMP domain-containing histidine kinase [Cytophaga sp.]
MTDYLSKGITIQNDTMQAKRIYFVNFLALCCFFVSIVFIIPYIIWDLIPLAILCGVFAPIYMFAFTLNSHGDYLPGKTILFFSISFNIFLLALTIGNQANMEVFYLPLVVILFMLYDGQEKTSFLWSIVLISLMGVVTFVLKNYTFQPFILLDKEHLFFVNVAFSVTSLLGTVALSYVFVLSSERIFLKMAEKNAELQTERNQLYDTTREQEDIIGIKNKVISIISHDVRQPVNNLLSVSDILLNSDVSKEEVQLLAKRFKESSFQVSQMLDNLLTWSYSQMNGLHPKPAVLHIKKDIEKELKKIKFTLENKKIKVESAVTEAHTITADPVMFEIVFRNILNNAIKFSSAGSQIDVYSEQVGKTVQISIKDQGMGIPPEMMVKLFANDLSKSRYGTSNEKGAGIGLMLCRQLMEANKGAIHARNNDMQGATFVLTFPA